VKSPDKLMFTTVVTAALSLVSPSAAERHVAYGGPVLLAEGHGFRSLSAEDQAWPDVVDRRPLVGPLCELSSRELLIATKGASPAVDPAHNAASRTCRLWRVRLPEQGRFETDTANECQIDAVDSKVQFTEGNRSVGSRAHADPHALGLARR
jgi:hypothetical protein